MLISQKDRIYVYNSTTEESVSDTLHLIERLGIKESFEYAKLMYDTDILPWTDDSKDECNYPLRLTFKEDEIWVSSVNAGYGGTGPHGTLEILKSLGVENSEVKAYILGEREKKVFIKIFQNGSIEML